ncbi:uncharacterized protein EHS24_005634 [Apiotrichum porosum]|uniref:Uncharacterized protein n=1 Tax=Apiotrichum porosum TaxID=105984 RepID=A0A427XZ81_9TREE|nr:uncharacterized protein EHS24_005634 [Apiotrichum porosum]RSH84131.1 hypothetical protein EHS24_005634 [Apiotrichum porosum]
MFADFPAPVLSSCDGDVYGENRGYACIPRWSDVWDCYVCHYCLEEMEIEEYE